MAPLAPKSSCAACQAVVTAAESFMDTRGRTVCRRCHYAEQVQFQSGRADESETQLGVYELFVTGKRLLVGGPLFVLGGLACVSLLRAGEWKMAGWACLISALGAAVILIAFHEARRGKR